MRQAPRHSGNEWKRLVRELERSGQPAGVFAARRGLSAPRLRWWCWHFRRVQALAGSDDRTGLSGAHPARPLLLWSQHEIGGSHLGGGLRARAGSANGGHHRATSSSFHRLRLDEVRSLDTRQAGIRGSTVARTRVRRSHGGYSHAPLSTVPSAMRSLHAHLSDQSSWGYTRAANARRERIAPR